VSVTLVISGVSGSSGCGVADIVVFRKSCAVQMARVSVNVETF